MSKSSPTRKRAIHVRKVIFKWLQGQNHNVCYHFSLVKSFLLIYLQSSIRLSARLNWSTMSTAIVKLLTLLLCRWMTESAHNNFYDVLRRKQGKKIHKSTLFIFKEFQTIENESPLRLTEHQENVSLQILSTNHGLFHGSKSFHTCYNDIPTKTFACLALARLNIFSIMFQRQKMVIVQTVSGQGV